MTPTNPAPPLHAAPESAAAELPFRLPEAVAAPPAARGAAAVVGTVVRFEAGVAYVDYPDNPFAGPVPARATVLLGPVSVGREAVLLFEAGDPARPLVAGLLAPPAGGQVQAELDGERVVLTAAQEVVLRCGEASITLTRAGKVIIRGTHVVSRSSGPNRIKGASVEIN